MRTLSSTVLLALVLTSGCNGGGDDSGAVAADGADGADGADSADGTEEADPVALSDMPNGTFYVNFSLAPVGGLLVPFQAEVASLEQADGSRTLSLDLKATNEAGELSDVLLSVSAALGEDGTWSTDETGFVLPGAFAPTGSDVEVSVGMTGSASSADGFCGTLTGSIVTFSMDLEGSTFGAVAWDDRDDGPVGACDAGAGGFEPIASCPTLVPGRNADFPSAELARTVELVVPEDYDASRMWPVVFAFHGLGGSMGDLLDGSSNLRQFADHRGILIVTPQGADFGGNPGWDAANPPGLNRDIQLFDDLLTCMKEQYALDANRVYATGMSNGGLMTGALLATRSDDLAAAAPFSGGVITSWPAEAAKVPALVTWGGEDDEAYDQDFHALSTGLIDELDDRGHFYAACDHGLGHELREEFWPWALEFLLAHPRGVEGSPFAGGLPESFPGYCTLPAE